MQSPLNTNGRAMAVRFYDRRIEPFLEGLKEKTSLYTNAKVCLFYTKKWLQGSLFKWRLALTKVEMGVVTWKELKTLRLQPLVFF